MKIDSSRKRIWIISFAGGAILVVWAVVSLTRGPMVPFDFLTDSRVIKIREDILQSKTSAAIYADQRVYEVRGTRESVAAALAKEAKAQKWRKLLLNPKHEDYLSSDYRIHVVPLSESGPIHVHVHSNRTPTLIDHARNRLGFFQGKGFLAQSEL